MERKTLYQNVNYAFSLAELVITMIEERRQYVIRYKISGLLQESELKEIYVYSVLVDETPG